MRVLLLRDARPGEFNKALGTSRIVAKLVSSDIQTLDARPRLFARNRVRLRLLETQNPGRALQALYGIVLENFKRPDLVIAAGRPTVAAGILIARLTGAKLLYCGFLRDYDLAEIDMLLVGSPRQSRERNCVLAPIPSIVDPDTLRKPRPLRSTDDMMGADFSLLLGGSRSGYRYSSTEWQIMANVVAQSAAAYGIKWRVTNSRRTPPEASEVFAGLVSCRKIEAFTDVRESGSGSAQDLFNADAILVTEDSLTMISEALAARRPVVALKPVLSARHGYSEELVTMACRGGLEIQPIHSATPEQLVGLISSIRVAEQDPRDLIAAAILPLLLRVKNSGLGQTTLPA